MARSCVCTDTCSCVIVAGENITVTGVGSNAKPYQIDAKALTTAIEAADSPSVDLTLVGQGTPEDPYILTAEATVALQGLTDVESGSPEVGEGPIWNGTQFVYSVPSVAPGQVSAGDGLLGDGSALNPLRVRTSGAWGTSPLTAAEQPAGQDGGLLIYLDSAGALRAQRPKTVEWSDIQNIPDGYGRRIWQSTSSPTSSQGANGDVWLEY